MVFLRLVLSIHSIPSNLGSDHHMSGKLPLIFIEQGLLCPRAYVIALAQVLAWTKMFTLAITFKPEVMGLSYELRHTSVFFIKMFIFLFSKCTLVFENFSRITVKISFLWGLKHGVYAAASFSANVTSWCYVMTRKFLPPLFCIWTSYLSHSDCLVVILKFYTILMFLHAVRIFINQKMFSSKTVSTFLPRK